MNKQVRHTYKGMIKDIAKAKFPNEYYFDANNIRITPTNHQNGYTVSNEKGQEFILTIPVINVNNTTKEITYGSKTLSFTTSELSGLTISNNQIIIGHKEIRDSVILFTTDNNGYDCIWELPYHTTNLKLLYLRDMGFSTSNPIEVLNNYENSSIDKVYWVDTVHQMRFINTNHSIANGDLEELIDLPVNSIEQVGTFNAKQPEIINILSGGNHTSGMIQYCYNLYRLSSSQTNTSSLSELISLDKGSLGGGDVNEIVSSIPVVRISDIDINYTHIKVYAIKYTSYNQQPQISLIDDREVPESRTIDIFDDGSVISNISSDEFTFLGSNIIIPKHIQSKYNRLFFANYSEINFDVELDTRAYSFDNTQASTVYTDVFLDVGDVITGTPHNVDNTFVIPVPDKFDSINLDYDTYKYQVNGATVGGEGKYLKYQLIKSNTFNEDARYFKDLEIYRLGIQFYNRYGQISLPKWIADFKAPEGNLEGLYNTISVTLKPDFYTWLNTGSNFESVYDIPTGYKVLVAERTSNDKTIIASGLLSTMMVNNKSTQNDQTSLTYRQDKARYLTKLPNILVRNCTSNSYNHTNLTAPLRKPINLQEMNTLRASPTSEIQRAYFGDKDTSGRIYQYNNMLQLYCPEVLFNIPINATPDSKLRIKGLYKNKVNYAWIKEYKTSDFSKVTEAKVENGLSTHYGTSSPISGVSTNLQDRAAFIAHPGGDDPNIVEKSLYYRGYGDINSEINDNPLGTNVLIPDSFTEISNPNATVGSLTVSADNTHLSIRLDPVDLDQSSFILDINPSGGYTTVEYDVKVCSDSFGNNVLAQLDDVMGVQNITYNDVNISGIEVITDYYIFIKPVSTFVGTIDLTINTDHSINTNEVNYEQLGIPFNIVPSIAPVSYYQKCPVDLEYDILGSPEVTEKGQSVTDYNNNPEYRYSNSLVSVLTDGDTSESNDGTYNRKIISVNVDGNKCITLVPYEDSMLEYYEQPTLESIFDDTTVTGDDFVLIGEIVKSDIDIYGNGLYGGNTWEDKHRTNYLEVGEYKDINTNFNFIESPGDTYVSSFKFLRMVRKDTEINDQGVKEYEEIVEYLTETTVDLKNRNDSSLQVWDAGFSYLDADYHKYNRVYSQQPLFTLRKDFEFNFKKRNDFDTNIISSKFKSSGELIDSWTDLLPNEVISLDGKQGPINALLSFKDNVFALQDRGMSVISIQPRIQVQGSDGIGIELGKGDILYDYRYITTDSGCNSIWSTVVTPAGIYYFDLYNKAIIKYNGQFAGITDTKGFHSYFNSNIITDSLKIGNPILGNGAVFGFDYINNDVLFTFHQNNSNPNNTFTLAFNEVFDSFTSFYKYHPSRYISRGGYYVIPSRNNLSLFEQFKGDYNVFYGNELSNSDITLLVNPEYSRDTILNNLSFSSEVFDVNNIEQHFKTITNIQVYNEYQDTGVVGLSNGSFTNMKRRFREWHITIPRDIIKPRARIRNPWNYVKLIFDNNSNLRLVLHDIIVSYTV